MQIYLIECESLEISTTAFRPILKCITSITFPNLKIMNLENNSLFSLEMIPFLNC